MQRILSLGAFVIVLAPAATVAASQQQKGTMPIDREFLIKTITCNHAMIKAGEFAESRSNNAKVKEFAVKLVKEHKMSGEKLAGLATDHKLAVLTGAEKETKEMLAHLTNATKEGFDREFIKIVVDEHEQGIKMFENQANQGADAELKLFAADYLPKLRAHLNEAKKLFTELNSK